MPGLDIIKPYEAPKELIDLYINQLFGHCEPATKAVRDSIDRREWAEATRSSYELWLSYAMLEFHWSGQRLPKFIEGRTTMITSAHEECLGRASKDDIRAYRNWAFPPSFRGNPCLLISPVHFWFFKLCYQRRAPLRPISPSSTNDLFRHPLFSASKWTGSFLLVVPEYFLRADSSFDGAWDRNSTAYYAFPSFAQRLFEYIAEPATGSFITYYTIRESVWFMPPGTDTSKAIDEPHPLFKRHWRWEEVLTVLYRSKAPANVSRLRSFRNAPNDCQYNEQIIAYFESFARMAAAWIPST